MAFDASGTYTKAQLQERQDALRALVFALPSKIKHMKKEAEKLLGVKLPTKESFPIHQTNNTIPYTLGDVSQSSVNHSMSLELLFQNASASKYGTKIDPLTRNLSIGDYVFRPDPILVTVDRVQARVTDDDTISQYLSNKTLSPVQDFIKRQEMEEGRISKLRYRGLTLLDKAVELEAALVTYDEDLKAVEKLLTDQVQVTQPDGTVSVTSDYPTAGIDQPWKGVDVTNSDDVQYILSLIYPPTPKGDEGDTSPATTNLIPSLPDETVDMQIDNAIPGLISELLETFPMIPRGIGTAKLQLLANVYEYGYKRGVMKSFADSAYLIRHPRMRVDESKVRYLAPNGCDDLNTFALAVYTQWGLRMRVTEAWPPTSNHQSLSHFNGNAVDIVLDVTGKTNLYNVSIPDMADKIIQYGKDQKWIQSGINEYKHETQYKTGPHIHLNMNVQYFNDARLFRKTWGKKR
jgi:hypothetical protein